MVPLKVCPFHAGAALAELPTQTVISYLPPLSLGASNENSRYWKARLTWHSAPSTLNNFDLTPTVFRVDFSRPAVPSYLFLRSGSTEPAPSTCKPSRRRHHEIQNIDVPGAGERTCT